MMILLMVGQPPLFNMESVHPGKILRQLMSERAWTQDELATITGISRQTIYLIIAGRSNVSAETAVRFAAAFGNTPEEWVKWDGLFRLSSLESETNVSEVEKMARLYQLAPIREMQKRGWIAPSDGPVELESELTKFFGKNPLTEEVFLPVAARRTVRLENLTLAERAWCFRARNLATLLPVEAFDISTAKKLEKRLRELAAFPKETRHVPKVLAEHGIRFVVIEPLAGSQIDGATLWMGSSPVVAMSIRHDRVDGFWFTLMHEIAHVLNGDASVDVDLVDGVHGVAIKLVEDEAESLANKHASNALIPTPELDSFIRRVGPLYPRERVIQFANKVRIHPGIVVGQLQYRKELGYSALRPFLVKVRDIVTSTALTDGWNQLAPQIA